MSLFGLNFFINKDDYENLLEEILEYYNFHNKIESIFLDKNIHESKIKEKLFFINSDWIKKWKFYTNYDEAIRNINLKDNESLFKKIILKNKNYYPSDFAFENSNHFLNKTLLKEEDFESVVNEKLYNLFNSNYNNIFSSIFNKIFKAEFIKAIYYKKMLVLLIDKYKRIKVIYKGNLENNIELIQLNIDFTDDNNIENK